MVLEKRLGIGAAVATFLGGASYEAPQLGGFFMQNEMFFHDAGIGLFIAAGALSLATAAILHYKKLQTEGEPIDPNEKPFIVPFNPSLSRQSSELMQRKARGRLKRTR